jgi:flavin reductase (DIM6/NTAB) family NADH-FMN oxidoreductase RutF
MTTKIGAKHALYPSMTVLAGANVDGKPNFNTIAHVGIATMSMITLSMAKGRYTSSGIKENKTFSVNIPSRKLVAETDYCGLVSGKNTDKSTLFEVFYGELKTAPMINGCPINMECKLYDIVEFPTHDLFIGEVIETYVDESVLTDGSIDIIKADPLLFEMASMKYWSMGGEIAKCWSVGKDLKK